MFHKSVMYILFSIIKHKTSFLNLTKALFWTVVSFSYLSSSTSKLLNNLFDRIPSKLKCPANALLSQGRDFPFSSCGRFFNTLPAKHKEESKEHLCDCLVSNFDLLLDLVSNTVSFKISQSCKC